MPVSAGTARCRPSASGYSRTVETGWSSRFPENLEFFFDRGDDARRETTGLPDTSFATL